MPRLSIPAHMDPDHRLAIAYMKTGLYDIVEVRNEDEYILFTATKVSPTSYGWRTPTMPASAFAPMLDTKLMMDEHDPTGRGCALAGRAAAGHDVSVGSTCRTCYEDALFGK